MTAVLLSLIVVVGLALIFDFINGFHDTANAVATVITTGVLPMRTAIILAAALNFVGAFLGTSVAETIGKDLIAQDAITQLVLIAALLGAIAWNLFTWLLGLPSSSSHALIGGLLGSTIAHAGSRALQWKGFLRVVESLVLSPLVGFAAGFCVMIVLMWLVRDKAPERIKALFQKLQIVSASFMAVSHGSNDAQKTMGLITMSLISYRAVTGVQHVAAEAAEHGAGHFSIPSWVILSCVTAMALGTAFGGVRIIKTVGTRIIELRPIHGFAAETSAAATILVASHLGLPVSTTHVVSGSIMGVGTSQHASSVRWGVAIRILWAWVLTIPVSALVAWGCSWLFERFE